MNTKIKVITMGIVVTLGIILFIFFSQTSGIPSYVASYVESQGWHVKKIVSGREKLQSPANETVIDNIFKLTDIDISKENEVFQERYLLKEKCYNEPMEVVVLTDSNGEVIGGYLIKTNTDPGTIQMEPYDLTCDK